MATLSIKTRVTIEDLVEAAEQLPNDDLESLARRLLQINARRRFPNLSQRESELLDGIVQTATFNGQERYHQLNLDLESRSLTPGEQDELQELTRLSEAQTGRRLALLLELSQLRRVPISKLMKQLQIKTPDIV